MAMWQIWLIVAGVCFVLEIATVGFLIFWFAVAALVTCILSIFISNVVVQTAIFVILSALLILLTRPFAEKIANNDNAITNANRIIGKEAIVKKEITPIQNGQIKIGGDIWTATLSSSCTDNIPEGSAVEIVDIDGVKAVVKPVKVASTASNK